jgi:hypothetical protein
LDGGLGSPFDVGAIVLVIQALEPFAGSGLTTMAGLNHMEMDSLRDILDDIGILMPICGIILAIQNKQSIEGSCGT